MALDRPPTDPARPASFLFSAAVHGCLLALVAFGRQPARSVKRPLYDTLIRPNEKKIVWYRKVPDILPPVRIGDSPEPRGRVKSKNTTISEAKNPRSAKQLILQQAPEIKLKRDIRAPNLIALAIPVPAKAPDAKKPKLFVPPAPPKPRPPDPVLSELDVKVTWTDTAGVERTLSLLRPKRKFTAPPPQQRPKLASGQAIVLEDAPSLESTGPGPIVPGGVPGPAIPKRAPPRAFQPPSGGGAGAPGGSGAGGPAIESAPSLAGGSQWNAAIIGLNPTDKLNGPLPAGGRSGQFSAAPSVGKPSSGEVSGAGGLALPGLVVKSGKTEPPANADVRAAAPPGSRIVLYDDLVPGAVRPTLSAPLRPSSRTIPRALEARFQGRLVYALAIPAPNLPAYAGDWIVWFAEQTQSAAAPAVVRAPIPYRKTEAAARPASADPAEARIQLAAIVKPDGRFESVTLIRGPSGPVSQCAIDDLKRWEFRPATRDGAAVAVEVVIEIPFRLGSLLASQ